MMSTLAYAATTKDAAQRCIRAFYEAVKYCLKMPYKADKVKHALHEGVAVVIVTAPLTGNDKAGTR